MKLGIAGERYLEVLEGLKDGDQVITGPFDSVRALYEGDSPVTVRIGRRAPGTRRKIHVSQLFESIVLALSSIWANKLRSLLTLLGNIVAVSSIITVVALITGVNAAVTDAIVSDLGADSFTVQRMGITQNEDDFERMRNNPLVTLKGRPGDQALRRIDRLGDGAGADRARVSLSRRRARQVQVQGVSEEYFDFTTFDAERGRMVTPTEISRKRPVTLIGWQIADRLFGAADPLDKQIRIAGVPFRWSASARRRARRSASRSTSSW